MLDITDQKVIWDYVLNCDSSKKFCNPFRIDRKPNCYLSEHNGLLFLTDWARPEYNNTTYRRAILLKYPYENIEEKIDQILNRKRTISLLGNISTKYKQYLVYKICGYNRDHITFWNSYGIKVEDLIKDGVFPIEYYDSNSKKNPDTIFRVYPKIGFVYLMEKHSNSENFKLYLPNDKIRFLSCCNNNDIWFLNQIDKSVNYLIITKSYKDARILKNENLNVISLQSENTFPSKEILNYLESIYENCYVLFDNDETGRKKSEEFVNIINFKYKKNMYFTKYKDCGEMIINYPNFNFRNWFGL